MSSLRSLTPRGMGTSLDWNPIPTSISTRLGFSTPKRSVTPNGSSETDCECTNVTPSRAQGTRLICDACDGPHLVADCPYYSKPRDKHPDAIRRPGLGKAGLAATAGNFKFRSSFTDLFYDNLKRIERFIFIHLFRFI